MPIRAKLLEIAAALDRIDRGDAGGGGDDRRGQIRAAIETLLEENHDRAERIQLIFSLAYNDSWFERFELGSGR